MKEITRIHIARTAYDIELSAKQMLEKYLRSLEAYSSDKEVLEDVEIRMTEILAERGVKPGKVISDSDVTALKEQLGEAEEFADDEAKPEVAVSDNDVSRKLYRDLDRRIIGGVLSGVGAYFKINPTWVRLIFIIVALASFGTALFVYAVLWIAIPPARTVADKLQMNGRPVTVNSIRELTENEATRSTGDNAQTRRVLTFLLGLVCVLGALVAAGITVFGAVAMPLSGRFELMEVMTHSPALLAAFILAIASGLLLVAMFTLGAYASFVQKLSQRVMITIGIIVVLGLASFGTSIGLARLGLVQIHDAVQANTKTTSLEVPSGLSSANSLVVNSTDVRVEYVVTNAKPHVTIDALSTDNITPPKVTFSLDGHTLNVSTQLKGNNCIEMWGCVNQPEVTIYGPALENLTSLGNGEVDYKVDSQPKLSIDDSGSGYIMMEGGQIDNLTATVRRGGKFDASLSSIKDASINAANAELVNLGSVATLELTTREACASDNQTSVFVGSVSSGQITFNGKQVAVANQQTACTDLTVSGVEEYR